MSKKAKAKKKVKKKASKKTVKPRSVSLNPVTIIPGIQGKPVRVDERNTTYEDVTTALKRRASKRRDKFAGLAMVGLLAGRRLNDAVDVSHEAVIQADQLIMELDEA